MRRVIRFTLNGRDTEVDVDPDRTPLWVIRVDLGSAAGMGPEAVTRSGNG